MIIHISIIFQEPTKCLNPVFRVGYQVMEAILTHQDISKTDAISKTMLLPKISGSTISCHLGHIFAGGYSAGYYSYKWAEALDADAFEYFKENGIFNSKIAESFRKNILEKGNTEPPMDLYIKFRGKEPDPDALLRRDKLAI